MNFEPLPTIVTRSEGIKLSIDTCLHACVDAYERQDRLRIMSWPDDVMKMLEASVRVGRYLRTGRVTSDPKSVAKG
jgi:hypothetical protein